MWSTTMKIYLRVILTTFLVTFHLICLDAYCGSSAHATPQVSSAEMSEPSNTPESQERSRCDAELSWNGFVEFESFFNTGTGKNFKNANMKDEIRNRIEITYGTENLYLYTASDIYLFLTYLNDHAQETYAYSSDRTLSRNLRISSQEAELCFNELYLNYGRENFRLRVGNQIYGWGTADAFNPTSYFNPSDMRELIFRDDDEDKVGVPSLSGMLFLSDYTLEAVFVPVHIPAIMPPEGNFWSLPMSDNSFEAVIFDEPEELDAKISHCGYGIRLSTSAGGVDISLSAYRGPDKDPLFVPDEVLYLSGMPVGIRIMQRSSVVSMFGVDFSSAIGDFVVQFEGVYSPDKAGVVEQDLDNLATVTLPFEVDRYRHISYATGFNYFIPMDSIIDGHTGDAVFTFEWFQSKYLEDGVYSPFITDIVSCKFQDSYLDGRIKMTVKALFDTQHGGKIFWPEVEYDFQNGLSISLAYADIQGDKGATLESDSIFSYYNDNDLLMGKIRYEY